MFRRKLRALQYPTWETTDIAGETAQLHALVVWLEDKKIRNYKKEDRTALRTLDANWEEAFRKYLLDLECTVALSSMTDKVCSASYTGLKWVAHTSWLGWLALCVAWAAELISHPLAPLRKQQRTSCAQRLTGCSTRQCSSSTPIIRDH